MLRKGAGAYYSKTTSVTDGRRKLSVADPLHASLHNRDFSKVSHKVCA